MPLVDNAGAEPNENEETSLVFDNKHGEILLEQPIGPTLKLNGNSIEELFDADTDEESGGTIEVPMKKSFIRPGDDELDLLTSLNVSCC
jgi:hypothetical protein